MKIRSSTAALALGAILLVPTAAACGDECDGNVTERVNSGQGLVTLRIHDGVGDDYCDVTRPASEVDGCQIGNIYPNCAG